MTVLKPPFPYFGNKRRAAPEIWRRFGNPSNYVEPFAGSLGCLLARPGWRPGLRWRETVNDLDGSITNVWRAIKADPAGVWEHADRPRNDIDLRAVIAQYKATRGDLTTRMMADPDAYDVKLAGRWVWGASTAIRWPVNGMRCVEGGGGHGIHASNTDAPELLAALFARLRFVQAHCKDAVALLSSRQVMGCGHCGRTMGVLLDPPYADETRTSGLYAEDDGSVAAHVRSWAIERGNDPLMRIALCGMTGEHSMPAEWSAWTWGGGAGKGGSADDGECIWFSPHCLKHEQMSLFGSEVTS